jgi:hypothetical protein
MKVLHRSSAGMILSVVLCVLVTSPRAAAQAKPQPIVLKGARLIDGTGRPAI